MQCRDQRGEQRDDDELRADGGQDGAAQHEEHAQPMRAGADDHGAGAGRSRSVLGRVRPGRWSRRPAQRLPGAKGRILRAADGRLGRGLTEGDAGRLSRMIVGSRARRSGCLTGCVTTAGQSRALPSEHSWPFFRRSVDETDEKGMGVPVGAGRVGCGPDDDGRICDGGR